MTLNQIKQQLKSQYPILKTGSEEIGYTELSTQEYEATINSWAENAYAEQQKAEAEAAKKAAAEAKLAALGLTADDLKALGL